MGIQQLDHVMWAFFARLNVGTAMRATTAGRMPRNIAATHFTSITRWKNIAMSSNSRKEGRAVPSALQAAPLLPRNLYPIKVEILMANTPGQLCAMAMRSKNSLFSIHLFFSTTSSSMRGIMAYPPPNVKAPILKKVVKSCLYIYILYIMCVY